MALTRVQLKNFTAFAELDLELSPGINVLVGANGTGKTHLMKVCYAACDVSKTGMYFREKLIGVFLPSDGDLERLIRQSEDDLNNGASVHVYSKHHDICTLFEYTGTRTDIPITRAWAGSVIESVYIPVKEMLSNAPGFRSLYAQREIHFEEVYRDILDRAFLPSLRDIQHEPYGRLISCLNEVTGGKVVTRDNEEFFLQTRVGNIEFTLLAEGMRKLALLSILMQNGSLRPGSVLFWDEPETNLNPKLYGVVVEVLLELQRNGVQIFLATHDYGVLKELELRSRDGDDVAYHSLYHDEGSGEIACNTARRYLDIHPNVIEEAFEEIYDRQIERSLGDFGR